MSAPGGRAASRSGARALARSALALAMPLITASAADEAWNQTAVRERFESIVSIAGDLRRDGVYTHPAMPMPDGWTELGLAYESRSIAWPAGSPLHGPHDDPAKPLIEDRQELRLRWRQNLGTPWLTSEVSIGGSHDDRTDDYHWSDLVADVVVPVFRSRYQAIAVAVGARTPLGDDRDWALSSGDFATGSWTGRGEVRGSFGLWLATLHARGGAEYVAKGRDTIADAAGHDRDIDHRMFAWNGALGAGVRATRWLRLGAEQSYTRRIWRARTAEAAFDRFVLVDAPLVGTVDATVAPGLRLDGWAGEQLGGRRDLRGGQRLVIGGGLAWVF